MKTSQIIPKCTFIFFFPHCIVLFPLRELASWRSAKCTRRLFKVWRNWPNSKLICYSVFHLNMNLSATLEKFSNYTQVYIHINFFLHTVLYCFHWEHQQVEGVQSAHGGSLNEGIGQIQNWYVILKEENLGFHLNIICRPFLKTSQIIPKCTFIFFFLHTVLYCFHWEHQQVEGVQSAHGGSLWYEGIGQIHNWYVILKEENLGFHLNINLSAIFENFSNFT